MLMKLEIVRNFRKHLSQYDFETVFLKILQTMHGNVYGYISYLAIQKNVFENASLLLKIF